MKPDTVKAVLFDMDGTIIDSLKIWNEIIKAFVGEANITIFRNLRAMAPGKGMAQTCYVLRSHFNFHKKDNEIIEMHGKIAQQIIRKHKIPFIDGFVAFHRDLTNNGIRTALATNAPNYVLNVLRKKLNLYSFFNEHIYNSCMVNSFKPDPTILLHTIRKLGVLPHECIMFEDSIEGIVAAQQAGIPYIIGIGNNNAGELKAATLIIKNYLNLNHKTLTSQLSL